MSEISNENRYLHAIPMGLGAWQWGDRVVWGYGQTHTDEDIRRAFELSVRLGIRFIDTAEVYGSGYSERLLGTILKTQDQPLLIATKYFPWPWRFGRKAIVRALRGSLDRIGVQSVDLYQIHQPTPLMSPETMMEGMADCVKEGLTRTVGVSNFGEKRMIRAYTSLAREGIPLASNQVHFSLLHREVEKNGLLARCKELGIRLIAYSPLEKGLLTGKYSSANPPAGLRRTLYGEMLRRLPPVIKLMQEIGREHGGKTAGQVALNWVICKGGMPIPGAKNQAQAEENEGGSGWQLTKDEVARLDEVTDDFREYRRERPG